MTTRNLFYLAIIFSAIRLGLSLSGTYILTHFNISAFDLGLIKGTANILFWIFILWLVFKIFNTNELKKYIRLLISLVILIIVISMANSINEIIWR